MAGKNSEMLKEFFFGGVIYKKFALGHAVP
jgi:hypothetical protein